MDWLKSISGKISMIVGVIGASIILFGYLSGGIGSIKERARKNPEAIHQLQHGQELMFYFARSMTDDIGGKIDFEYADDDGMVYNVDHRKNDNGNEFAFVYKIDMIYPIYRGPNGWPYIMLFDSETQNTDLIIKK